MASAPDFSTDCLLVTYGPDLRQLTGRWLRSVAEAELRQRYEARRQAAPYACRYWLVAARHRVERRPNGPE